MYIYTQRATSVFGSFVGLNEPAEGGGLSRVLLILYSSRQNDFFPRLGISLEMPLTTRSV